MPVSPKVLKAHGCTPADWKPLFTAKGNYSGKSKSGKLPQIKRLETLIANRINDGRLKNLQDYRVFAAIDMAYDAPFDQTTPTLIQSFLGQDWSNLKQEDVLAKLQQWGLKPDDLLLKTTRPDGSCVYTPNPPTFYKILVPLVKAYVTIRRGKLFNDRNKVPLLDYEPIEWNSETRILCEILNHTVQVISGELGYPRDLDQTILQTLQYATTLVFPREVWYTEYQMEMVDGKEKKVLQKEGIRYCQPHPTRMFWDQHYSISSFNTDSGCEFAGYWKVVSYGDILDNQNYWNRKAVGFGSTVDWFSPEISSNFFSEVYPCQMAFPNFTYGEKSSRESSAIYYATSQRDMAVFQTDVFMKLTPAKWKLGTYKYPIWVRFIVANDNSILYAEPVAYSPVLFCGYDTDQLRAKNASMALEVLPFQDHIGNTLSQIVLTIKQNLANIYFYEKNVLNREDIDAVKNAGEMQYRTINMVPYDSFKNARAGLDVKGGIIPVHFDYKDVTPMFQSMNTMLSMLERLLQLSAQESGAAASHQQSKEEIQVISGNTSNRVQFTGSFIDDFIDAWKRQQYDAIQAYADDELTAMVPGDIPDIEEHLEALGFKKSGTVQGEGKLIVKGSKRGLLKLQDFAVTGKGPDRKNDTQTAQIMMQAAQAVSNSQVLAQAIGAKPLLKIIERAAIMAGADKDFKLRPDDKAQANALQQMAQEIMQAMMKKVNETVTKPAAEEMKKIQDEIVQLQQVVAKALKLQPPDPRNVPVQSPAQPQPQPPTPDAQVQPQPAPGSGEPGTPQAPVA